jgi:hypothetical protein
LTPLLDSLARVIIAGQRISGKRYVQFNIPLKARGTEGVMPLKFIIVTPPCPLLFAKRGYNVLILWAEGSAINKEERIGP